MEITLSVTGTDKCEACGQDHDGSIRIVTNKDGDDWTLSIASVEGSGESAEVTNFHSEIVPSLNAAEGIAGVYLLHGVERIMRTVLHCEPDIEPPAIIAVDLGTLFRIDPNAN